MISFAALCFIKLISKYPCVQILMESLLLMNRIHQAFMQHLNICTYLL